MVRLIPDPFETLFNIQRSLDAFQASDWLSRGPSSSGAYPPLNVFRQGDDFVVITELPGIQREDVEIQVQGDRVRIAGKKAVQYEEGASLHRRERIAGNFDRSIAVPIEVDADRVKAEYHNGILALLLPRAERDKPKSITIS
jgi:HSP20 family protein